MKKTLLLLPALMLAGCQMLNYQEPTGEDTAAVVFTGNEAAQPVVCVPGRGFKDTKISLAVKPWDTNAFNELFKTMRKAEQVPVTVAADGQTRIGVVYNERDTDMRRNHCRVAVQFNAQADTRYFAHFTRNEAGQCGLEVRGEEGVQADAVPVDWDCP
ncbi:hypothetical protein [Alloalcanivorax venustensis]|jgi:hypothetical protein|uniref:hypothetical protein n=2 Tax=Alloalcanivorax venustensis TaxID=172371 RepID=UPI000E8CBF4A|nr:hypothetical protein [Alcanivorax sp.]MCH9782954.1 hypothetical protein [Gammaproteobacteria bacterium]MEA3259320.1 hypothetical protein [Pseudomonadota bacterium]MCH2551864.1 hypothetical protein [Alcanivorax sp.]MEC8880227.1 hypothetical protein [Pseudomonadota bacterium]|tara:strand:- start:8007 stop:8480 length:474 start_codon:yes stop_codon:yes gene_type:complete